MRSIKNLIKLANKFARTIEEERLREERRYYGGSSKLDRISHILGDEHTMPDELVDFLIDNPYPGDASPEAKEWADDFVDIRNKHFNRGHMLDYQILLSFLEKRRHEDYNEENLKKYCEAIKNGYNYGEERVRAFLKAVKEYRKMYPGHN